MSPASSALYAISPAIRRSLGIDATLMDRLAVFALLHDLGKCNTGFQAKCDPNSRDIAGHVKETAALFYDHLQKSAEYFGDILGMRGEKKWLADLQASDFIGVPTGIRTPVTAVKGRCPRPLDDGDT